MKTLSLPAAALAAALALALAQAHATPLAGSQAPNRIVGAWEFPEIRVFHCISGQTFSRFRAASLYHAGGTMVATQTSPLTALGPAFGIWTYIPDTGEYVTRMRLYRYNPDGSFAGATEVTRTARLSADGDHISETFRGKLLNPDEQVLFETCGSGEGVRSL